MQRKGAGGRAGIEELSLLDTTRPASFDDLVALNIARRSVEALLRACAEELGTDPKMAFLCDALTVATELSPSPARGSRRQRSTQHSAQKADPRANLRVRSFWREFAPEFAWDFLPLEFLHALYAQWLHEEFPGDAVFTRETFGRRLKATAIASGEWVHARSRPGYLMGAAEPLLARTSGWVPDESDRAFYGFRRSGS